MKTVCIYHSIDLDGWMSAAIVKRWFWNIPITSTNRSDKLDFIGWNHGDPVPDLSEYQDIILVDISFDPQTMLDIQLSGKGFIWNDHHISSITKINELFTKNNVALPFGERDINLAACELTWKNCFPQEPVPEIVRLLGMYDTFRFRKTEEEQEVLEFQYGARSVISNYEEAYKYLVDSLLYKPLDSMECPPPEYDIGIYGRRIYNYMKKEAEQTYKKAFTVHFGEYVFLAVNQARFNPIAFGINYHNDKATDIYFADGFASFALGEDMMWHWTLYNDNGKVDCSLLAAERGGGGHRGAAGMRLNNKEQFKFLDECSL